MLLAARLTRSSWRSKPFFVTNLRSAPSALPKGKKTQKDSLAFRPQGAAETEVPAKYRAKKLKRQEAPRETFNRFAPLAMEAKETIPSIWGDFSTPSSQRASASPMECPPPPPNPPCPRRRNPKVLHPQSPCDGGGEATQND
ncbi:hypothetical protein PoB_007169600 [Plakobranchus ocellatus]|uniref:Uncharacterized protein n=1 Tax=Plakobranchus ocellatus TaxID=259542 RepID=A0AAV4DMK9_9GAST|nr:hypothetical protein PoB_007169600 [Plakobranchus ocellatus]